MGPHESSGSTGWKHTGRYRYLGRVISNSWWRFSWRGKERKERSVNPGSSVIPGAPGSAHLSRVAIPLFGVHLCAFCRSLPPAAPGRKQGGRRNEKLTEPEEKKAATKRDEESECLSEWEREREREKKRREGKGETGSEKKWKGSWKLR